MKSNSLILIVFSLTMITCNSESQNPSGNNGGSSGSSSEWLIPQSQVFDGGPGKDGIPALSNPDFVGVDEIHYLTDDDLVIGFSNGGEHKAYPHNILDWHEIINDDVKGKKIAVTYCPLTGTGIGWDRIVQGTETTFGVSGLLYNTNLIPYDRLTDSNWSQVGLQCVNGVLKGSHPSTYQLIETTWKTWKELYPDSRVVSEKTGFSRNYTNYPYGDYKTNNSRLLFPVSSMDDRLPAKERVLAVIVEDKSKVYRFDSFKGDTKVLQDQFNEKEIIVIGNKAMSFMVAFSNNLNGSKLQFQALPSIDKSMIFRDNLDNKYNVFGEIIEGPNAGDRLLSTTSFMAFWFSVGAFYSNPQIFEGGN